MMPAKKPTLWAVLVLSLVFGFCWGYHGHQQPHTEALQAQARSRFHYLLGTEVQLTLSQREMKQGQSPKLTITLKNPNGAFPPSIADGLRLHLARPGGFDAGRSLVDTESVTVAASDDGRHMVIIVCMSAFESEVLAGQAFEFLTPGNYAFKVSIESSEGVRIADSAEHTVTVLPRDLETV